MLSEAVAMNGVWNRCVSARPTLANVAKLEIFLLAKQQKLYIAIGASINSIQFNSIPTTMYAYIMRYGDTCAGYKRLLFYTSYKLQVAYNSRMLPTLLIKLVVQRWKN